MKSLSASAEFKRLIKALVGKAIGEFPEDKTVTVVTDMNEAILYDQTSQKGVYSYTIYSIESLLTDDGEISVAGTAIPRDGLIKVEYSFTVDGVLASKERSHAVIDLGVESAIPEDIKSQLIAAGVGELSSSVSFDIRFNKDNVKTRKIEYVITDISLIAEIDEDKQSVTYLNEVTENSIVTYSFYYLLDGVEVGVGDVMTIDLSTAKEGHYLNIKNALLGKSAGEQDISVIDEVYCQPFMDFRAYTVKSILGYVEIEQIVSFKFVYEDERDTFNGGAIYQNTLPESNPYSIYAVNEEACDEVLRILGGITADQTSTGAQGVVGTETVAVGLNHTTMEKFGLYDGHKVTFSLPRGLNPLAGSDQYNWMYNLDFNLYISDLQPDGTRYVGSEMYDIVVKIDGKYFDYLDFSFTEYWSKRNLVMIDVANIDKVGVEFNMADIYGGYDFTLKHETYYYTADGRYPTKPEGVSSTEYDFITVRVKPLGDRHSENELVKILAERNAFDVDLASVYNQVAGIAPGGVGLSVGYDTLGTSSFKDILRILYSTYYLGVVSEEDMAKGEEENRLMRLSFDVGTSSAYSYTYDFYRIDDRRVMVSFYRMGDDGTKIGVVSDFYVSTFAFKKIVTNFQNLLNGVEIDTEAAY